MRYHRTTTIDAAALYAACRSENPQVCEGAYQYLRHYLCYQLTRPAFLGKVGKATVEEQEDCLQEAMVAIWARIKDDGGPREPNSFLKWSARILANKIVDWHRQAGYRNVSQPSRMCQHAQSSQQQSVRRVIGCKRIPRHCLVSLEMLYDQDDENTGASIEHLADPDAVNPAQASEDQEFREILLREIFSTPTLNPGEIAVILGSFLDDQSDQEMAAQLTKSPITIRVIRKRGLEKVWKNERLKRQLSTFCYV